MPESNHHEVMTRTTVDFWMDPLCPWSWLTARWLLEVQEHAPVEVRWGVMSMAILEEGNEIPEQWREFVEQSWGPLRALVAAEQQAGPDAFVPLMGAIARRWHVDERRDMTEVIRESVEESGLPSAVAVDAWDSALDDAVRRSHESAVALGGSDVGSPILAFDGPKAGIGYMGPIISRVPQGAEAVALFDAVHRLAQTPGFFELKSTRTVPPQLA
jgi:protein-disulfide isomerase-like protein with CxxC motif